MIIKLAHLEHCISVLRNCYGDADNMDFEKIEETKGMIKFIGYEKSIEEFWGGK